jgi:cobalamin biosynthesis protein CobD/CbiB
MDSSMNASYNPFKVFTDGVRSLCNNYVITGILAGVATAISAIGSIWIDMLVVIPVKLLESFTVTLAVPVCVPLPLVIGAAVMLICLSLKSLFDHYDNISKSKTEDTASLI